MSERFREPINERELKKEYEDRVVDEEVASLSKATM